MAPSDHTTVRRGIAADAPALAACVDAAYAHYVPRMGKKPAPMLADYRLVLSESDVYVAERGGRCIGLIVFMPCADHLFVENVAVMPAAQGRGIGRRLLALAEAEARRLNLPELRLYTNEKMTENLDFYARLGFEETERRVEDGYARVFLRKRLDASGGAVQPR